MPVAATFWYLMITDNVQINSFREHSIRDEFMKMESILLFIQELWIILYYVFCFAFWNQVWSIFDRLMKLIFRSVQMDFSKKPERENPRKKANLISQLFFVWIIPLLWKGMKNGLTKKDLTKCLKKDRSDTLGDDLEK